jgi:cobalt-zinc-cadmium efflux system protein
MEQHRHEHGHHDDLDNQGKKSLMIALLITGMIMVVEFAGGFLSNSLALMSDAGHMLTDCLSLVLSLSALHLSRKPSTMAKTYGYYRVEILAATINGTVLMLISIYIFYEAVIRLLNPSLIKVNGMIGVAVVGLVGNVAGMFFLRKTSAVSLNIHGALLHMLSDTLSSVGVILGGIIIAFTGWTRVDPVLGILISVLIFRNALSLVKESVNILLESVPKDFNMPAVQSEIERVPGVKSIHDVHVWTITSGFHALSGHLFIDDLKISEAGEIVLKVKRLLRDKYGITHTTLELECAHCGSEFICDKQTCVYIKKESGGD